jgi:hypothetical protein
MAEVTGDFGGQPIQLNNAATEATLKQLLAAMTVIANNTGKDKAAQAKSQKELEAELKKLAAASKKQTEALDSATKAQKKADDAKQKETDAREQTTKALKEEIKSLNNTIKAVDLFNNSLEGAVGYLTKTMGTFSNLNSSMSSAAQAMGAIPLVGNMLASTFGVVAQAGERTYKAFQQASSVGANFGGSINDMINSATSAGMTFDQFAGVIAKNGESIALLGQGAGDGAKRLAELGSKIRKSPLNADLARLGYSTEDINSGMAQYVGILAKTGKLQGQNDEQLVAGSANYLKNMDELSKLTGKSKDALKAEQDALMADAAFRLKLSKMDPEGAARLTQYMKTLGPTAQKGMKEYIAFGNATSDHGREFATLMQKSAGGANAMYREIQQTGTVSQASLNNLDKTYRAEARAVNNAGISDLYANVGNNIQQGLVLDNLNIAAQKTNLEEIKKQSDAEQAAARKRAADQAGVKDGLDPAQLQRFQQLIAELNNRITQTVANYMPELENAFKKLASFVENWMMPAFKFLMDNIETVTILLGAMKIASILFKGALAIKEFKMAQRGSSPANAMYVRDASGGLLDTGGKGGKGGKGGGAGGKVLQTAKNAATTAAVVVGGSYVIDAAAGALGVGGNEIDEDQDEKNWQQANLLEKAQSGLARTIENIGSFVGLTNMANQARSERIASETAYLNAKTGKPGSAAPGAGISNPATGTSSTTEAIADAKELEKTLRAQLKAQVEAISIAKAKNREDRYAAESAEALADAEKKKREIEARLAANSKKIQEGLTTTTKELSDAKKAELDAAKKAEEEASAKDKKPGLDFSSPQALYNSFKAMRAGGSGAPQVAPPSGTTSGSAPVPQVPGASAIGTGLGAVAEKYESAGRGSGTVGWDKSGGTSYGKKQISSKAGAMTDFLKFLEKTGKGDVAKKLRDAGIEKDTGSTSGKAVDVWKEVAASGALGNSENEFLGQGYGAALKGLKDQGLQSRINGSRALQEMLYSTAVQHGPSGAMGIFNSVFKPGMTDEQLVKAVYAERGADDGKKHFSKSKPNERAGVVNRFGKEQQDIMALLSNPGSNVPSTDTARTALTPTPAPSTTTTASTTASSVVETQTVRNTATGSGAPSAGGVSSLNAVVASLEMLNMQMGQLIALNKESVDLNANQLRGLRAMSTDMFMSS